VETWLLLADGAPRDQPAHSALSGLLGMLVGLLAVGVFAFAVIGLRRLCGLE
jgi:predicted lipid-binding transport protein (Tim44 family)